MECGFKSRSGHQNWRERYMEKPLHVLAAEALGWRHVYAAPQPDGTYVWCGWNKDMCENCHLPDRIPLYDQDWSASGPEIERLQLSIGYIKTDCTYAYQVCDDVLLKDRSWGYGDSPLTAFCKMVVEKFNKNKTVL